MQIKSKLRQSFRLSLDFHTSIKWDHTLEQIVAITETSAQCFSATMMTYKSAMRRVLRLNQTSQLWKNQSHLKLATLESQRKMVNHWNTSPCAIARRNLFQMQNMWLWTFLSTGTEKILGTHFSKRLKERFSSMCQTSLKVLDECHTLSHEPVSQNVSHRKESTIVGKAWSSH